MLSERTPDGHPQVWLLYRPEPWSPFSEDERAIHLWMRRCDVFTSKAAAEWHLSSLQGVPVEFRPYDPLFPELWIWKNRSGARWLLVPAPIDPPGGQ